MISMLIAFAIFAALQLGSYVRARNVLAASAASAVKSATEGQVDPRIAGVRADQLIGKELGSTGSSQVKCTGSTSKDTHSGLAFTTVHCHGHLEMAMLPVRILAPVDVTASALQLAQP